MVILSALLVLPTAAQEPTTEPTYDPACPMTLLRAYMSGWEYNHRDGTELDTVQAAQVARAVYTAFEPLKINCGYPNGYYKQNLLRTMRGDYPPEDLARMLGYLEEVVGEGVTGECAFVVVEPFIDNVEWGDAAALEVGRAIGEIFRTVRETVPTGECDANFNLITNLLSQLDEIPPDGSLVRSLYDTLTDVTQGQYFSEYTCGYQMANTFFDKVDWDGMTSSEITRLVESAFRMSYDISGDKGCDEEPALEITSMLLNDVYQFEPDASIIQRTYDAASGLIVPVEATPTGD
ncbi:MAG: hypothetical protein LCI00_23465 [Chloroflexi bacterium]|nr:hypothetical protein [Chloroflexota bacterium]MCC6896014.1 hypothetical protein [Anaerolineae bacterium]